MEWIKCEDRLPELGVPVWMYLPDIGQPVVGGRVVDEDGWLWGNVYDAFFWSERNGWEGDIEIDDDYQPTHWMPLPEPPEEE